MKVEYGGIKASGGKLFVIMSLLTTLGGGLWGGFEFYKDYKDMKEQITSYVAPDLSGFDKRLEVMDTMIKERMKVVDAKINAMHSLVSDAQDTARDIRTDIKTDINEQSDQISAIDKRSRSDGLETRQAMRTAESEVRQLISDTSKRWDDKLQKVDSQIEALEQKIDKKIMKALENPLAAMSRTK